MKHSFIDLLTPPDSILFQFEDSIPRFEEPSSLEERKTKIEYLKENGEGIITVYPTELAIKRIKLRWRGDMSDVISVLGDTLERNYDLTNSDVRDGGSAAWRAITPELRLPWYFHAFDGERLNSFGVKTGADALCAFYCDEGGITLWLDLRCGGQGVVLREPLVVARVVCREGTIGENPFVVSRNFCRKMCEKPILPNEPVFGINNWYWAYGEITHETVMAETNYLMDMCADAVCSPYMIIDDGWQINRAASDQGLFIGGPWFGAKGKFDDPPLTAHAIKEKGAKPGIWFRPLLTSSTSDISLASPFQQDSRGGVTLDPSHPATLEYITNDVSRLCEWGYELIKHDFSTYDILSRTGRQDTDPAFYNKNQTNATIIKNLYKTIQSAAGDRIVIGCNTVNHLVAGLHAVQRSAQDTSGRCYEITRTSAAAAMLRLPQNGTFFNLDPDCAAFTDRVPIEPNLDFLKLCSLTGVTTLASVKPGILNSNEMSRIRKIFRTASMGGKRATPSDWLCHNVQSKYTTEDGEKFFFDWYKTYNGTRMIYDWRG